MALSEIIFGHPVTHSPPATLISNATFCVVIRNTMTLIDIQNRAVCNYLYVITSNFTSTIVGRVMNTFSCWTCFTFHTCTYCSNSWVHKCLYNSNNNGNWSSFITRNHMAFNFTNLIHEICISSFLIQNMKCRNAFLNLI